MRPCLSVLTVPRPTVGRPSYGFKRSGGERGGGVARAAPQAEQVAMAGGDEENPPVRPFLLLQTRYFLRIRYALLRRLPGRPQQHNTHVG